jgi:hypothetical protein
MKLKSRSRKIRKMKNYKQELFKRRWNSKSREIVSGASI